MIFLPDFFAEIRKIELEMKDLVERTRNADPVSVASYTNPVPPLDIYEKEGYIVVVMDVPGVDPENLKVQFNHGFLIIAGRKEAPKYEMKRNFVCLERNFGTFKRKIYIQRPLDFSNAGGELKDGILTIRLKLRTERRGAPVSVPVNVIESEEVEFEKKQNIHVKEEGQYE